MEEKAEKQDQIEVPEVEDAERREKECRRGPAIISRPEAWSVLGRPAQRRLFRVNCGE